MRLTMSVSFAAIAALALAACGQSASDSAPGGDPDKAMADMSAQFQPGQYRTSVKFGHIDISGVPPAQAAQMKSMMTLDTTSQYCITPEKAKEGIAIMKEHMGRGSCKFESFNAASGAVDMVFACNAGAGMSLKSVGKGKYSSTGSEIEVKADMAMAGGMSLHAEQTVTMERIGDCT